MSLIFRGLKRLTGYKETDPVEFNETRFDQVTEISTKGFDQKQRKVVFTLTDESLTHLPIILIDILSCVLE